MAQWTDSIAEFEGRYVLAPRDSANEEASTPSIFVGDETGILHTITQATERPYPKFRRKVVPAGGAPFILTKRGVLKVHDTTTPTITQAGLPKLHVGTITPSGASDPVLFTYRLVIGYRDATGRIVLGPPTAPRQVTTQYDPATATMCSLQCRLLGFLTGYPPDSLFVQIYRSRVDSGDELFLVDERPAPANLIGGGFFTLFDRSPPGLEGAALYTNQTQDSILQANDAPPKCSDMVQWSGMTFAANTLQPHSLTFQIGDPEKLKALALSNTSSTIGQTTVTVSSTTGVAVGMSFRHPGWNIVNASQGMAYPVVTEVLSATQFVVSYAAVANLGSSANHIMPTMYLTGPAFPNGFRITFNVGSMSADVLIADTGSQSVKLEKLAEAFISGWINWSGFIGLDASVASAVAGVEDPPGKILIEARWPVEQVFGYFAHPNDPLATAISPMGIPGQPFISESERKPGRLHISKQHQPEAFPRLQFEDIGDENEAILALVPLRDSLFVVKERSLWQVLGQSPANLSILPLDLNIRCVSGATAQQVDNIGYYLSDRGVVAFNAKGIMTVSHPVRDELLRTIRRADAVDEAHLFHAGVNQSDEQYILSSPPLVPTQVGPHLVLSTTTGKWSTWDMGDSAASVTAWGEYQGALIRGQGRDVRLETQEGARADYADVLGTGQGLTLSVLDENGRAYTDTLPPGLQLLGGFINDNTGVAYLYEGPFFDPLGIHGFRPVSGSHLTSPQVGRTFRSLPPRRLTFHPAHGGLPETAKRFLETTLFFQVRLPGSSIKTFAYRSSARAGFTDPHSIFWNDAVVGEHRRMTLPRNASRGNWLEFDMKDEGAFGALDFAGWSLVYYLTRGRGF